MQTYSDPTRASDPHALRNARLIAAAPDLLAALRAIVATNPVADYVLDIHALEIRNIARSAIAKATGQ